MRIVPIVRLLVVWSVWAVVTFAQAGPGRPDFSDETRLRAFLLAKAEKTVYPERCAECHRSEFEVWKTTPHATKADKLHTLESAKKIYKALNLRLIRRATDERTPACLQCHYTPKLVGDDLSASIGVSCESCHGPASEWIDVHNKYGVAEPDYQKAAGLETPAHKQQRIADSRAKGQLRPSDLYGVAANCFQCHTVPNEDLVNTGEHSSGSVIDLVERIDKIRHNFLHSFLTADGKTNAETPVERKRLLALVGRALDLEYSVRGVAAATKNGAYLTSMVGRYDAAVGALLDSQELQSIPEVARMLEIAGAVALEANNQAALIRAADQIGAATRAFLEHADGAQLGRLDPLWNPDVAPPAPAAPPPAAGATGPTPPRPTSADPARGAGGGGGGGTAGVTPPPPVSAPERPPTAPGAAAPTRGAAPRVQGEILRRPPWRPEPSHKYFSTVPCANACHHKKHVAWWKSDPHSGSAAKFVSGGARQKEIATAYGLTATEMTKGNQICMNCHGTIGNPNATVRNGVGCQQCHGPGFDFREPHQDGDYADSVGKGMLDLKRAEVRARTCAGCHYITDPRLVSAGHTNGSSFKIDERVGKIRHWGPDFAGDAVDIDPGALQTAYAAVVAERGPAPAEQPGGARPQITPPPGAAAPAGLPPTAPTGQPAGPPVSLPSGAQVGQPVGTAGQPARGAGGPPPAPGEPVMTPGEPGRGSEAVAAPTVPTPTAADPAAVGTTSVDELLRQVKLRLEELYRRLRRGGSQ